MTGRRASEILTLDHDPIEAIPGAERPPGAVDDGTFVAKLRYQQTKVDGVVPTILVEQAVVNVIREQQQWLTDTFPGVDSKYLFIGVKHQFRGREPRPYATYRASLAQLDRIHGLTDFAGQPLKFTQTHRLRHTRATELLNDGVPFHVVQLSGTPRSEDTRKRIDAARRTLKKAGQPVNINAVAAKAGVSRATIYRHPDLADRIRAQRNTPSTPVTPPAPTSTDDSVIHALRRTIRDKDEQIHRLRAELQAQDRALAAAHAEIERLTPP
ncbi:TetR family transcriptional regulator [Tsukamurella sp. 8F]|uniref:TetR family transcriptional regulator n=1 Tax=unclassified Tsukamurella TaxID=2633480 RepID=UPI0023B930E7|nr:MULTISPECIES: TetR family transcriptional regulator [unclassified Tsukamurella]MDF0529583.1 TetR family transcriptional regulator [Tsukamurella sp. 8J]MDF0585729.1 TetR family transcriptional regulator [Tsukamurella sp. 8F]